MSNSLQLHKMFEPLRVLRANQTDVLIVLPISAMHKRYFGHFELSRKPLKY